MYKAHPAAEAFPLMDDARFAEHKADVAAHGLREPIVLCDGMILDGRNRHRACVELGVTPTVREFTGDPWAFAWSANGARRDLGEMQRALIWRKCAEASAAWTAERQRIAAAGNRKRSEATKEQHQESKPWAGEKMVVDNYYPLPPKKHRARQEAAKSAHVTSATMQKADLIAKRRPDLADQIIAGAIKPTQALRQIKKDEIAKVVSLPSSKYRVIYADPPWSYNDKADAGSVQSGGAEYHYPSMTIAELAALDVPSICADDAVLFLWVTAPLLFESLPVFKAWGFKYRASFVWDKVKHNMGHYNSVRHEFLLVCVKGSCQPDHVKLFDSVQSIERTAHSVKPEAFREFIDTLYPHGKRIELFARRAAKGWDVWGNQAGPTEVAHG